MLLGLTRPTAGAAHVFGMNVSAERRAILQRTAFVSEKKTLYPSLTPTELVRFSRECSSFLPSSLSLNEPKYDLVARRNLRFSAN
jgi:ABC-type multidrug transport system ATPase subunit